MWAGGANSNPPDATVIQINKIVVPSKGSGIVELNIRVASARCPTTTASANARGIVGEGVTAARDNRSTRIADDGEVAGDSCIRIHGDGVRRKNQRHRGADGRKHVSGQGDVGDIARQVKDAATVKLKVAQSALHLCGRRLPVGPATWIHRIPIQVADELLGVLRVVLPMGKGCRHGK